MKKKSLRKRKTLKNEKGITLIALVITVVILIILATISINFVFGENGLVARAEQATQLAEEARATEDMGMYLASIQMEETQNENFRLADYLSNNIGNAGHELGTIGIIGPTRMDYSKVISVMKYISKKLNE